MISPPWGPQGELIHQRTYARTKSDGTLESWPETVDRVVRGNLGLVYGDPDTWAPEVHTEAQQLSDMMTAMKIIPAGRHLWASGVPGRQFLQNCFTAGWTERFADHFTFTLLRLAEGGGVGSNYSSRFLKQYGPVRRTVDVEIVCRPDHADYAEMAAAGLLTGTTERPRVLVRDTREGWAETLDDLLSAYFLKNGRPQPLVIDVSYLRPKGSPLVSSGGTASGPEPFARMLLAVAAIMNRRWENNGGWQGAGYVTPLDAMENDHEIGACVVAGGNRRAARMSILPWDDPWIEEFLECKRDPSKHWTTNVSVGVDEAFFAALDGEGDPDRQDLAKRVLRLVAEGMLANGEPGIWNMAKSAEGEPQEPYATNPCFHPDTIVETVNGPRRIADITEPTQVYTKGPSGGIEIRKASAAFLTKRNAETVTVHLNNGTSLTVTPDHRLMRVNGNYVRAGSLNPGDRLDVVCRARRGWRYTGIKLASQGNRDYRMEHRVLYEGVHGKLPDGMDVDHINRDHHDNRIDNLRALPHAEHARLSRYQVPNNHQVLVGNRFVPSGNHGRKPIEGAIRPPRATGWPGSPRVVRVDPGPVVDVYDITVEETHNLIANGVVSHNCGEIILEPWEPCNLGHVNLDAFAGEFDEQSALELIQAHTLMTRFLMRATYGDVTDEKQAEVMARNRRIGVGHFGVQGFLAKAGLRYSDAPDDEAFRGLLGVCYRAVREEARRYAFELRIPEPIKVTTVAPTGTIAKLAGRTEGIHPVYAKHFLRRVRFSTTDPADVAQVAKLATEGHHVEPCRYAADTVVVEFPTEDTLVAELVATGLTADDADYLVESSDELTLDQMFAFQAMYQEIYADNAVSYTANVKPGEHTVDDLVGALRRWLPHLKGTTVFPDLSREQSPYERMSAEEYAAAATHDVGDSVDADCATGACPIK